MKPKIIIALAIWGIGFLLLLTSQCVFPSKVAGNGSQTPNSVVVGTIYEPGGKGPARGDSVVIRSCDYLADIQKLSKRRAVDTPFIRRTRTNDSGYYRFDSIPKGMYCIEASDNSNNRVLIEVDSSLFQSDTIELPPDTLKAAVSIRGKLLTGYDSTGMYVRVFGLDIGAKVGPDSTFTLENLPEGNLRLLISVIINNGASLDTIVKVDTRAGIDTIISLAINLKAIEGEITFQKTLYDNSIGNYVQQTSDGGYVICGFIDIDYSFAYLLKTDATGTTIWIRTFRGDGKTSAHSVQQTSDGGYIILGSVYNPATNNDSLLLIKTDATGTAAWTKTFGGDYIGQGNPIRQTGDGGYIIVGGIRYYGAGNGDVYLIKTDATGTAIWTKTFGGADYNYGNSVQQTSDGGYIVVGGAQSWSAGTRDIYLIKTDSIGTAVWTKTFSDARVSDAGMCVQQMSDGGFMIAGTYGIHLIKTDSIGTAVWTRLVGRSGAEGTSAQQTSDGGYIIVGDASVDYGTAYSNAVYLLKTDATGIPTWSKTFRGDYDAYCNSGMQTSDGGYIITGFYNRNGNETFLIKTDKNGDVK